MSDGWRKNIIGVSLTAREMEVLGLVSQGLRNKAVARQLGVVEGTVKLHLHSIFRKTGIANRAGLIPGVIASR